MALFKPVLLQNKRKLENQPIVYGQYIQVIDSQEIYVDTDPNTREKVSQNIYFQKEDPAALEGNFFGTDSAYIKEGDIWIETDN